MTPRRRAGAAGAAALILAAVLLWALTRHDGDRPSPAASVARTAAPATPPSTTPVPPPPGSAREWGLTFLAAAPDSDPAALGLVRDLVAGHRPDGAAHGITSTRTIVPWDVALPADPALGAGQSPPALLAALDRWVATVIGLGLRPMVSFEHSRSPGYAKDDPAANPLPTPAQYRAAMVAFLAHYAAHGAATWDYTAWNEPNLDTQPTTQARVRPAGWPAPSPDAPALPSRWHFGAAMAVRYLVELRALCGEPGRSCRVLPGDFSGRPDFSWDASGWYRTYRHFLPAGERLWAWHDYRDVTEGTTADLRAFMDAVPGARVWVTEVGPIFFRGCDPARRRRPCPPVRTPEGQATADAALTRRWAAYVGELLGTPAVWDRLHGLTYYMVYGDRNWDSGLISRDGAMRPGAYAPLVALSALP
jgi:hypothetical protein